MGNEKERLSFGMAVMMMVVIIDDGEVQTEGEAKRANGKHEFEAMVAMMSLDATSSLSLHTCSR
jgi:hypothetical protein